jgi:hypothetical protein
MISCTQPAWRLSMRVCTSTAIALLNQSSRSDVPKPKLGAVLEPTGLSTAYCPGPGVDSDDLDAAGGCSGVATTTQWSL